MHYSCMKRVPTIPSGAVVCRERWLQEQRLAQAKASREANISLIGLEK